VASIPRRCPRCTLCTLRATGIIEPSLCRHTKVRVAASPGEGARTTPRPRLPRSARSAMNELTDRPASSCGS
jgi:hypothetical protein